MNICRRTSFLLAALLLADVTSLAQSNKNKDEPSPKKDEVNTLLKQEFELEDKGDFAAAIEISKKICKLQPNDPRPLNTIAGLYGKLGKFEEEITWAKEAIAVDSQYAPAYVNLGNALASSGKLAEAQIIFSKAAELAPKDPLAVYSLGVIAEQENKPYEALGFYNKSVELDPKFENGYFNLAALYANLKRYDEAVTALHKVLEINPKADDAKAMLADIEKRRTRP